MTKLNIESEIITLPNKEYNNEVYDMLYHIDIMKSKFKELSSNDILTANVTRDLNNVESCVYSLLK
jgi:hypothetical protein